MKSFIKELRRREVSMGMWVTIGHPDASGIYCCEDDVRLGFEQGFKFWALANDLDFMEKGWEGFG